MLQRAGDAIKWRGLPCSPESVRAYLAGRKTQTRRVVRPQPILMSGVEEGLIQWEPLGPEPIRLDEFRLWALKHCPYGVPGDGLYVRETHYRWTGCGKPPKGFIRDRCYADHPDWQQMWDAACLLTIPSILMPRWAARIFRELVERRLEQLQIISEMDALAEGIIPPPDSPGQGYMIPGRLGEFYVSAAGAYLVWWDLLHAKRGCGVKANPWNWVLTTKETEQRP